MGKNRTDYYCQGGTILSLNVTVWYGRLKLLFSISVQVDGRRASTLGFWEIEEDDEQQLLDDPCRPGPLPRNPLQYLGPSAEAA